MAGEITGLEIRWSAMFTTDSGGKDEDGRQSTSSTGSWQTLSGADDYGLRQALWSNSGTSENSIEETVDFTSESGSGSGFNATVVYRKYPISGTATFDSSGNLVIDGNGKVQLDFSWDDNPTDDGTALGTVEYDDLGVSFTQGSSTTGSDTTTKSVESGTYNVSFTGMNSRGFTRQNSNTTLCFRDDDANDCNATLTATFIPGEERVKIRIKSITSYGTGYEAGDVLSTTRWNSWPSSASRILKVTSVASDPPPEPDAPTASLSASPSTLTIGAGGSSTLTWSSTNGTSYSLTDIADPGASGSQAVSPAATKTYTYTVSGDGGTASASATVTVEAAASPTASVSVSPSTIIIGGSPSSATLTWSSTNGSTYSLTDVSSPGASGSSTVAPTSTRTYTYTVTNISSESVSDTATLTVYTKPEISISADPTKIIAGSGTKSNIEWSCTGTVSSIVWTSGGITNTNVTSEVDVEPGVSTTYCAYPKSDLAGNGTTKCVTVTVVQRPTLDVTFPTSIAYNAQSDISYTAKYTNTSLTITPTYTYLEDVVVTGTTIDLTKPNSAEPGVGTTEVTDTYTTTIPYTSRGPISVTYVLNGSGEGGSVTKSQAIPIDIDMTPENLDITENKDLLLGQPDIINPGSDTLTDQYLIDDIDIDVQIKSNFPIQVQVNNSGIWENVKEL